MRKYFFLLLAFLFVLNGLKPGFNESLLYRCKNPLATYGLLLVPITSHLKKWAHFIKYTVVPMLDIFYCVDTNCVCPSLNNPVLQLRRLLSEDFTGNELLFKMVTAASG